MVSSGEQNYLMTKNRKLRTRLLPVKASAFHLKIELIKVFLELSKKSTKKEKDGKKKTDKPSKVKTEEGTDEGTEEEEEGEGKEEEEEEGEENYWDLFEFHDHPGIEMDETSNESLSDEHSLNENIIQYE